MSDVPSNAAGRFARFASGRRSKWLILAFWVVVLVLAFSPAGKLTGAQENDAVSWLPGDAESTEVLHDLARFQSSDEIPAVVVYERPSGATSADIAAVAGQLQQLANIDGVDRDPIGPIPSEDRQALQVIVPIDAGSGGWESLGTAVDAIRDVAASSPAGLSVHITGPGGFAADSSEAFAGIDGTLLYSAVAVVVVILLLTYRSPVLWLLPVISAVVALFVAQAVIYFLAVDAGLTVNAQSAGHPDGAGLRRRDGLRPAAGRPLPGGAAPPRGPARGDGLRAAPVRPGDPRQRLDGDRRDAVPAVRRA